MFLGTSKDRKVTLNRKPLVLDKAAALEQARRERGQREADRQQVKAATLVQTAFRGYRAARLWRRTERAEWDAKLADIGKLATVLRAAGKQFGAPLPIISSLLRSLAFTWEARDGSDSVRLINAVSLVDAAHRLGALTAAVAPPGGGANGIVGSLVFGLSKLAQHAFAAQVALNRASVAAAEPVPSSGVAMFGASSAAPMEELAALLEALTDAHALVPQDASVTAGGQDPRRETLQDRLCAPLAISIARSQSFGDLMRDVSVACTLALARGEDFDAVLSHPLVRLAMGLAYKAAAHCSEGGMHARHAQPVAAVWARIVLPVPFVIAKAGGLGSLSAVMVANIVGQLAPTSQSLADRLKPAPSVETGQSSSTLATYTLGNVIDAHAALLAHGTLLDTATASAFVAAYATLLQETPARIFAPSLASLAAVSSAFACSAASTVSQGTSALAVASRMYVVEDDDDDNDGDAADVVADGSGAGNGGDGRKADKNPEVAVRHRRRQVAQAVLSAVLDASSGSASSGTALLSLDAFESNPGAPVTSPSTSAAPAAGGAGAWSGSALGGGGFGSSSSFGSFGGASYRPSVSTPKQRRPSPTKAAAARLAAALASAAPAAVGSAMVRTQVRALWQREEFVTALLSPLLPASAAPPSSGVGALALLWSLHKHAQLTQDAEALARAAGADLSGGAASSMVPDGAASDPLSAVAHLSSSGAGASPLSSMWAALSAQSAPAGSSAALLSSASGRAFLSATNAFVCALCTALASTDDLTLRDGGRPMPLAQLREVALWAKTLLFQLAWHDPAASDTRLSQRHPLVVSLIDGTMRLLNALFDRHARVPLLASDEEWLWPQLPASELTTDVILGIADDNVPDEAMAAASASAGGAGEDVAMTAGATWGAPAPARGPGGAAPSASADVAWEGDEDMGAADGAFGEELDADFDSDDDEARAAYVAAGGSNVRVPGSGRGSGRGGARAAPGAGGSAPGVHAALGAPQFAGAKGVRQARIQMVLTCIPFVVPFRTRVALFNALREVDRQAHLAAAQGDMQHPFLPFAPSQKKISVTVRRASLVEDAFRAVREICALPVPYGASGSRLKDPLYIQFVNKEGLPESGIDGGGLLKEFVDSVVKEAFASAGSGGDDLFSATPDHRLYPNPAARCQSQSSGAGSSQAGGHLARFTFLGRLLGKALYEGILIEPRFALFFLRKLLGRPNAPDDLSSLDPELHRSLLSLRRLPPAELAALGLTFELTEAAAGPGGAHVSVALVPGGSELPVTPANVDAYIRAVGDFRLNTSIAPQVGAFLRGFRDLIPVPWLRMFGPRELDALLGGLERPVDLADLRANVSYSGGYHDSQPYIATFWRVLAGFSDADMRAFLAFVTSCSRPPLLGFGALRPKFGITRVPIAADNERLPSAGTCFNALKLPQYSSEAVLREKLLLAIRSGSGFELT